MDKNLFIRIIQHLKHFKVSKNPRREKQSRERKQREKGRKKRVFFFFFLFSFLFFSLKIFLLLLPSFFLTFWGRTGDSLNPSFPQTGGVLASEKWWLGIQLIAAQLRVHSPAINGDAWCRKNPQRSWKNRKNHRSNFSMNFQQ